MVKFWLIEKVIYLLKQREVNKTKRRFLGENSIPGHRKQHSQFVCCLEIQVKLVWREMQVLQRGREPDCFSFPDMPETQSISFRSLFLLQDILSGFHISPLWCPVKNMLWDCLLLSTILLTPIAVPYSSGSCFILISSHIINWWWFFF